MAKERGLPYPSLDYFPDIVQRNADGSMTALATMIDTLVEREAKSIEGLYWLKVPEACPSDLLDELGYELAAGIEPGDSEAVKRVKILTTITNHKTRGTWDATKPIIDEITGYSSALWHEIDGYWWIRVPSVSSIYTDWAIRGDGGGTYTGLWRIGTWTEAVIPGNIFIDLGNGALSAAVIAAVWQSLATQVAPAYCRIFLGYVSGGEFVVYAGGIIP